MSITAIRSSQAQPKVQDQHMPSPASTADSQSSAATAASAERVQPLANPTSPAHPTSSRLDIRV
jgi:hypothetical protein